MLLSLVGERWEHQAFEKLPGSEIPDGVMGGSEDSKSDESLVVGVITGVGGRVTIPGGPGRDLTVGFKNDVIGDVGFG